MRSLVCALLLGGVLAAQVPNQLSSEEKKAGWILLFDGKSLKGWNDPAKQNPKGDAFVVEDGCIKATKRPKFREDLKTLRTFTDFELQWEWKISEGGNSGVKYRMQETAYYHPDFMPEELKNAGIEKKLDYLVANKKGSRKEMPADGRGEGYSIAFEYQVIDNERHADAKRSRRAFAGALYQLFEPQGEAAKKAGEWNQSRLVVKGDKIEHWLNGVKVVDANLSDAAVSQGLARRWTEQSPVYKLLTTRPVKAAPIVLQNHNDEAWFRSIKIRPL